VVSIHPENGRAPLSLRALRHFMREQAPEPARVAEERCEMCSEPLGTEHRHLLDLSRHTVMCACDACALLFASRGAAEGKYRLIPRRRLALQDFQMPDEQWDELMLPVDMVYLFRSSEAERARAFYPSPAGAMESLLTLENWDDLVRSNPLLNDLEPDVEALLINRVERAREYFVVPIDVCYRLVGLLRVSWKGLSGGNEAREAIAAFFADLRTRAEPASAGNDSMSQARNEAGPPNWKPASPQGETHA
jgi:uncharacterized protein DUF5947